MIDIDILKKNYASMEDFQLMQISKEASELSMDGFIVLKREIVKRGLDRTFIDEQEKLRVEQKIDRINNNLDKEDKKFITKIWNLALLKKSKGYDNKDIVGVLTAEGLNPDHALLVVENLEEIATRLFKDADNGVQGGLVWIVVAIAGAFGLTYLGLSKFWLSYFLIATLARGIFLLYTSSVHKERIQKVLNIIEQERINK